MFVALLLNIQLVKSNKIFVFLITGKELKLKINEKKKLLLRIKVTLVSLIKKLCVYVNEMFIDKNDNYDEIKKNSN